MHREWFVGHREVRETTIWQFNVRQSEREKSSQIAHRTTQIHESLNRKHRNGVRIKQVRRVHRGGISENDDELLQVIAQWIANSSRYFELVNIIWIAYSGCISCVQFIQSNEMSFLSLINGRKPKECFSFLFSFPDFVTSSIWLWNLTTNRWTSKFPMEKNWLNTFKQFRSID